VADERRCYVRLGKNRKGVGDCLLTTRRRASGGFGRRGGGSERDQRRQTEVDDDGGGARLGEKETLRSKMMHE
jgi:hypothetical protein